MVGVTSCLEKPRNISILAVLVNPRIVKARSPCDPKRWIHLEVDNDVLREFYTLNARAKLGEYAGLVHGDVPALMDHPEDQRGMRSCHAVFQGLSRPLNKDMGTNLFAYVSDPPCTFRYSDPFDACASLPRPADAIFVTYVEFTPEMASP